MGRVKLQIKKIENTTNRQVTFSKRRNGLIKKAYEISVLCEVDVAVIMFSPSGRLSSFSGNNKSIEDIFTRFLNLPEQDRGRLQNREYLQRALDKLKSESSDRSFHAASPAVNGADSQLAEIRHELEKCKSRLEEMEERLKVYECDPCEITTMCEAQYRERIFEHNLNLVRQRKRILEEKFNPIPETQTPSEVNLGSENTMNTHDFAVIDTWLPPDKDPHSQIINFLDPNGLLPLRDETGSVHHHQPMDSMVVAPPPASPLLHVGNAQQGDHRGRVEDDTPRAGEFFAQLIDVNVSSWTEYGGAPAANVPLPSTYPRDRAILEAFISQLTTPTLSQDHI